MNVTVVLNWKSYLAIGAGAALVIMAFKLKADAAEHVMKNAFSTCQTIINSDEYEDG